jgi:hypothetical protein
LIKRCQPNGEVKNHHIKQLKKKEKLLVNSNQYLKLLKRKVTQDTLIQAVHQIPAPDLNLTPNHDQACLLTLNPRATKAPNKIASLKNGKSLKERNTIEQSHDDLFPRKAFYFIIIIPNK